MAQPIGPPIETANPAWSPLQDVLMAQPAVLIGLIAHLVGTPLQDDIVAHRPNPGERHWTFGRWRSRGAFFIGPVLCVQRQTRPLSFAKAAAQLLTKPRRHRRHVGEAAEFCFARSAERVGRTKPDTLAHTLLPRPL
jgi:hypothetical protein